MSRMPFDAKHEEKILKGGQTGGGFLNSFLTFIGANDSDKASSTSPVKKPVLPKYIPELTYVEKEQICESIFISDSGDSLKSLKTGLETNSDDVRGFSSASPSMFQENQHVSNNVELKPCLTPLRNEEDTPLLRHIQQEPEIKDLASPQLIYTARKRSRNSADSGESSSSEVNTTYPPPMRRQSARRAKDKVEQRKAARIKKGKRLLSLYIEESGSSDLEEMSDEVTTQYSINDKDYDSDKDPGWRPYFEHGQEKKSQGSDNEIVPVKKRRGRPAKNALQNQTTEESLKIKGKEKCENSFATSQLMVNSTTTASLMNPKVPLSAAQQKMDLVAPSYRPLEKDAPHSFGKGDFVIDRKDLTNYDSFPIWKIDSGRLLQKYELFDSDGRTLHRSLSTYSSWTNQINSTFKAIEVVICSSLRGNEVVEVVEKYRPLPPEPSVNITLLKEAFNIYIQILVSQSLEPSFLGALLKEPDDYYMNPLQTIDGAIAMCLLKMKKSLHWTELFLKSINKFPSYHIEDCTPNRSCQATGNENTSAKKLVRFYGKAYDQDTLQHVEEAHAERYEVGADTVKYLPMYHDLQHLKMKLLKKCQIKVGEIKQSDDMDDHAVLDKCLMDRLWIKQLLQTLLDLVEFVDSGEPLSSLSAS